MYPKSEISQLSETVQADLPCLLGIFFVLFLFPPFAFMYPGNEPRNVVYSNLG